jgi:hypothetical protein
MIMTTNTFNIEEITDAEKRNVEDCYILGKLSEDRFDLPHRGIEPGKSVSLTNFSGPDKVVFFIESISTEPSILSQKLGKTDRGVFVTFDNRNRRYLERFHYSDIPEEEKVDFIRNHFKGKLILFKPIISYERNREKYHYNLEILLTEPNDEENFHQCLPVPSIKKGITHSRFEKMLMQPLPFELTMYNHSLDIPEFIVCDRYLYQIEDPDATIEKYSVKNNVYICRNYKNVKRIPLPENWNHELVKFSYQDLAFIKTKTKMDLISILDEQGELLHDIYYKKSNSNNDDSQTEKKAADKSDANKVRNEEIGESQFIERLQYLADLNGLIYEPHDLINFHTSLKTSRFSILGGMSGTGKTELARLYAEALGLQEGNNLLIVPVSPSFTEPSDILGFLHQQSGVYMESETGIISFLNKASQNPKKMFMLVLDEMNLGQVEHYFSPFISLLEARKDRVLKLFSDRSFTHHPEFKNINIGPNVLFVGTANFDETTKDFSNRMLDRSNVIILEKKGFLEAKLEEEEAAKTFDEYQNKTQSDMGDPNKPISSKNFLSWIKEEKGLRMLLDHELTILENLHKEISNFDSQTGVSFRIAKSIGHYLDNIPQDEVENYLLSRELAFDYQIKQRILTKVRGHRDQIESLVGRIEDEENYKNGKLGYILDDDEDFQISRKYLKQKAKELMRNGYTL